MAPFKLKFRMGSSRSTSQEQHDPDPQVNEALLGAQQHHHHQQQHHHQETVEASSSSSLDLADCSSLGQMSSERKLLLPPTSGSSGCGNGMRLGKSCANIHTKKKQTATGQPFGIYLSINIKNTTFFLCV